MQYTCVVECRCLFYRCMAVLSIEKVKRKVVNYYVRYQAEEVVRCWVWKG